MGDFHERLPMTGFAYSGFVDPSGGSDAAMTLAIGHKTATPKKQIVIDLIREVRPPFDPAAVVDNFAALLKTYRVSKVLGDHYGGEFVRRRFVSKVSTTRFARRPSRISSAICCHSSLLGTLFYLDIIGSLHKLSDSNAVCRGPAGFNCTRTSGAR